MCLSSSNTFFKGEKSDKYTLSPFVIHVAPVYTPEKAATLRQEKFHMVDILNEMKTNKNIQPDFNAQLRAELEAEYILFLERVLRQQLSSEEEYIRYVDELDKFYRITGSKFWDARGCVTDSNVYDDDSLYADFLYAYGYHPGKHRAFICGRWCERTCRTGFPQEWK